MIAGDTVISLVAPLPKREYWPTEQNTTHLAVLYEHAPDQIFRLAYPSRGWNRPFVRNMNEPVARSRGRFEIYRLALAHLEPRLDRGVHDWSGVNWVATFTIWMKHCRSFGKPKVRSSKSSKEVGMDPLTETLALL